MANGWTSERRARQVELIRTRRRWEQSTGPRTSEGKAKSASNGDKDGQWKSERDNLRALKLTVDQLPTEQRELLVKVMDQVSATPLRPPPIPPPAEAHGSLQEERGLVFCVVLLSPAIAHSFDSAHGLGAALRV